MSGTTSFDSVACVKALVERFPSVRSHVGFSIDPQRYISLGDELCVCLDTALGDISLAQFELMGSVEWDNLPTSWVLPELCIREHCSSADDMADHLRLRLDELFRCVHIEITLPPEQELVRGMARFTIDSKQVLGGLKIPLFVDIPTLVYSSQTRRHPSVAELVSSDDLEYMWNAGSPPDTKFRRWT